MNARPCYQPHSNIRKVNTRMYINNKPIVKNYFIKSFDTQKQPPVALSPELIYYTTLYDVVNTACTTVNV
jgi:hypothetical protein